jgi:hypothetical protein
MVEGAAGFAENASGAMAAEVNSIAISERGRTILRMIHSVWVLNECPIIVTDRKIDCLHKFIIFIRQCLRLS